MENNENIMDDSQGSSHNETTTQESTKTETSITENKVAEEGKQTEDTVNAQAAPPSDTVTLSKAELSARDTAIRNIAERRAKRQVQQAQQQQQTVSNANDNVDLNQVYNVWDQNLGTYVQKPLANLTVAEYAQIAAQQPQAQAQQPQTTAAQVNSSPAGETPLTESAIMQVSMLQAQSPEAVNVIKTVPVTDRMANAVALDPNGIKNLYEAIKDRPHEIYAITQLKDPVEQQAAMWRLNQEARNKSQPKVETNATPQPKPLSESGVVNKSYEDMSYAEKKELDRRERQKNKLAW